MKSPLAIGGVAVAAAMMLALSGCATSSGGTPASTSTPAPLAGGADGPAATATGPAGGKTTATATTAAPAWPTPEDCVTYNPNNVTSHYEAGFWSVNDGAKEILRAPGGPADDVGTQGLALAQRYSKRCYIGRANTRTEDRDSYIFDYWRDPSGRSTVIPDEDNICSTYNKGNLTVEDMGGGQGWRVKDHDHVLHLFDNETDARNGKLVLAKYSQICFIGNGTNDINGQDQVSYSK